MPDTAAEPAVAEPAVAPVLLCMSANSSAGGTHIAIARENSEGVRVYTLLKASDLSGVISTASRRQFNDKVQKVVDAQNRAIADAARSAADKELDSVLSGQ